MLEKKLEAGFKLPIEFSGSKRGIPKNLYEDLELLEVRDGSSATIYEHLFSPKTLFGEMCIHKWARYFTTDVALLRDTQKIYARVKPEEFDGGIVTKAWDTFKTIKDNDYFIDKYQYIDVDKLKWLNRSSIFLTILSLYSILSPALNLLAPLLLLLVPFVVLRMMNVPLTLEGYKEALLRQLSRHSFGRLFTHWGSVTWSQRVYMLMALGMYVYNIYQNIISCYQFYQNTVTINQHFRDIVTYLRYTKNQMSSFVGRIGDLVTYKPFKNYLSGKLVDIGKLYDSLNTIPLAGLHPRKVPYLGYTMKCYYLLYDSEPIEETLLFSFGFHGYLDTLNGVSLRIRDGEIHKAQYVERRKPYVKIRDSYYPIIEAEEIVPNTIDLSSSVIVTGPNASGKTSLLKNTIINLLLSQQVGFGFYRKATITPFHFFHCYLNIPDTTSRDSLFQAEARRCHGILQNIQQNSKERHFCIFDELFSGTNPYEAIGSAHAYLNFISKFRGVKFMLTTHFIRLCDLFRDTKRVKNMHMSASIQTEIPTYHYKLATGISTIKGGITVLRELGYPRIILEGTREVIGKL